MSRLAFWFGLLELGFVAASLMGDSLPLLVVSAPCCLALMWPETRQLIGRADRSQALRTPLRGSE